MKLQCLFLLIFYPILGISQSPWVPGKGGQYHQVSFSTIPSYDKLHTSGESFQLERFVTDNSLQYYGEVGLGDHFSFTAVVPFKLLKAGKLTDAMSSNPISESGNLSAFGDIEMAAKYQIVRNDNLVLSGTMLMGLPTSQADEKTGLRSGFNVLLIRPGLSIGTSKEKLYTYAFLNYSLYNKKFASNIYWGLEFGWKFSESFIIAAHLSSIQTIEDGKNIPSPANLSTGLYLNGYEFTALQIKLIKEIIPNRLGIVGSLGGGIGNLVAQAPSITLGIYTKLN